MKTYWPLILLLIYILTGVAIQQHSFTVFDWRAGMTTFMGLFFLSFSFFKFLDLRGFAMAYREYDLVAKALPFWGFVYPFVEFALGLSYLNGVEPFWTNVVTLVVMSVSLLGVVLSVVKKRKIKCACMGTVFNLPMSTVTVVEDLTMVVMAAVMLWM